MQPMDIIRAHVPDKVIDGYSIWIRYYLALPRCLYIHNNIDYRRFLFSLFFLLFYLFFSLTFSYNPNARRIL